MCSVSGMERLHQVRVQLIISYKDSTTSKVKSEVFENTPANEERNICEQHAEEKVKEYLDNLEDLLKVRKLVFFQNYGPCEKICAPLIAKLKERFEVEIVYVKQYANPQYGNGIPSLKEKGIKCHRIEDWRWTAFLLWNANLLHNDLEWWKDSYEHCMSDIKNGLKQVDVEHTNTERDVKRLLQETVYNMCAEVKRDGRLISIAECAEKVYVGTQKKIPYE